MGLDYVDIFYSHRFDPDTPLEETMSALAIMITQGKALYAGISTYSRRTVEAARLLADLGVPLLIHQPSYSMFNRWIEDDGLLETLEALGAGCIALAARPGPAHRQVPRRHPRRLPGGHRRRDEPRHAHGGQPRPRAGAGRAGPGAGSEPRRRWRGHCVTADDVAGHRASSVAQLEADLAALDNLAFTDAELDAIDKYATDADINLWDAAQPGVTRLVDHYPRRRSSTISSRMGMPKLPTSASRASGSCGLLVHRPRPTRAMRNPRRW